ncbi:protein of unknown function [Amycolatopsis arida]|uniref:DUF4383 domain-containing protein n=1 Tax=Amycolatopsis arida TaxID=587909 RepID=A0A1I5ZTG8_9PSEU|nr:DUF4383 domain-containing protein [Amycolatopsis arida]TDX89343.1 uncharacterized protein DUF4383 [Amycolatopsis arida]SFQ59497.1 protein of unknown function [Amycolatopsis arida]
MTALKRFYTRGEAPEAGFARTATLAVAAVFLLVGILGFVPLANTDFDQLAFAGPHSDAKLLGLFTVSVLHNAVHLLFAVAGFVMARTGRLARAYLLGGGAVYLGLWLYGLVVDEHSWANFVPVNDADDWLHLGLAAGMLLLGWFAAPGVRERRLP